MQPIKIAHFSDILCVWAYVGQGRLNRLTAEFGDKIAVDTHFCSVFPDTWHKISTQWKDRDGFNGYARHVQEVAAGFRDLPVHKDVWAQTRPRSSASAHLFVHAVELIEQEDPPATPLPYLQRPSIRAAQELRSAFFVHALDVAHWDVQRQVAATIGIDFDRVMARIMTGEAIARLASDYDMAQALRIEGSPTYVLNQGRQKLFGNVSLGVLEANVNELLSGNAGDMASLCS